MRNWQMERLELLQEVVGRHKRATDGEKPEEGMSDTSGHRLVVLALPGEAALPAGFCCCSNLLSPFFPS